jgi:hypothetical protein
MFVVMHDVWQGMKGKQTILGKVKEKLFNGKDPKDPPDGTGGSSETKKPAPAKEAGKEGAAPKKSVQVDRSAQFTNPLGGDATTRMTKTILGDTTIMQTARALSSVRIPMARVSSPSVGVKPTTPVIRVKPTPVRTYGFRGFGFRGGFAGATAGVLGTATSCLGFFFDGVGYAKVKAQKKETSVWEDIGNVLEGMDTSAGCLMWGPGSDPNCPGHWEHQRMRYRGPEA